MLRQAHNNIDEITFQQFLPPFLAKNAVLVTGGATCIEMYRRTTNPLWLLGMIVALIAGVRLVLCYNAQSVRIVGFDVILQHGGFTIHTHTLPIWETRLEVHQSLFGHWFDYGTIRQRVDGEIIELRGIAQMRSLSLHLAQRRRELITVGMRRQFLEFPQQQGIFLEDTYSN